MENVLKVQVALVDPEKNWDGMNEVSRQIDCSAYVD